MIRKIFNNVIFIILIFILTYVCYSKYIRKDCVIKIGGYGFLIVVTGSMDPTIEESELIVIKECENYKVNDIVTYMDLDGNLITHRIIQINEYGFISKGDSNEIVDEDTTIDNIQGKVVYHSKILGIFIFYYLKFVVIIYLIVLIGLYFKDKFMKENYDEKEEK